MNSGKMDIVENKLNHLHKDAKKDYLKIGKGVMKSIFRPIQPTDFEHAYLPISREQGQMMRQLIIDNKHKNVVEFGTSFGISTIYLADAVRQTGGSLITTELLESKAQKAKQNIEDAGLSDYVEIRIGDAMQTLKGHATPIDFLFLDGWKNLYLPLFQMLETQFHSDTMIYADNINMADTQNYVDYVLNKRNNYSSQLIAGGNALLTRISQI